jgi:hypothetical protein
MLLRHLKLAMDPVQAFKLLNSLDRGEDPRRSWIRNGAKEHADRLARTSSAMV